MLLAHHHALVALAATLRASVRAAYTLPAALLPGDSVRTVSVPGLAEASVITLVLRASKPAAAEGLYMLASIADDSGTAYTDLAYAGRQFSTPAGLSMNTYASGFTGSTNVTLLDGGRSAVITAKFFQRHQSSAFELYVDGQQQELGSFAGHLSRIFSDRLVIGDTAGYRWPGTIFALKLYLTNLSEPERQQAEASL